MNQKCRTSYAPCYCGKCISKDDVEDVPSFTQDVCWLWVHLISSNDSSCTAVCCCLIHHLWAGHTCDSDSWGRNCLGKERCVESESMQYGVCRYVHIRMKLRGRNSLCHCQHSTYMPLYSIVLTVVVSTPTFTSNNFESRACFVWRYANTFSVAFHYWGEISRDEIIFTARKILKSDPKTTSFKVVCVVQNRNTNCVANRYICIYVHHNNPVASSSLIHDCVILHVVLVNCGKLPSVSLGVVCV